MEQDLISIVVPIYKVEKYLEKCVESICNQTYRNLEIILVDDGSPDQCGAMCEEYASKDDRIKVIHKKNGGLSDARNAGIDVAKGTYIGFVDSDDYIHPSMFEILYKAVKENDAEISVCNFFKVEDGEYVNYKGISNVNSVVFDTEREYAQYAFEEKTMDFFTVAWNKLYKRELFDEIRYPFGKIHEDEFTTYKLFHLSKKAVYVKEDLYFYVQRAGSIMANGFDERSFHKLEAYEERLNRYAKEKRYEWYERVLFMYRLYLVQFHKRIKNAGGDVDKLKGYHQVYKEQVFKNWLKLPIGFVKKIGYLYLALFPEKYYVR